MSSHAYGNLVQRSLKVSRAPDSKGYFWTLYVDKHRLTIEEKADPTQHHPLLKAFWIRIRSIPIPTNTSAKM